MPTRLPQSRKVSFRSEKLNAPLRNKSSVDSKVCASVELRQTSSITHYCASDSPSSSARTPHQTGTLAPLTQVKRIGSWQCLRQSFSHGGLDVHRLLGPPTACRPADHVAVCARPYAGSTVGAYSASGCTRDRRVPRPPGSRSDRIRGGARRRRRVVSGGGDTIPYFKY
eukprot:SAG31_NODE_765_length_12248_cov_6.802947_8_plen_169_part_00